MEERDIPNTNEIESFLHCAECIEEMPDDISPSNWQDNECGWTVLGFQVWCKRHDCNILHVDFQGIQHPANTTRRR